jgi:group I intron endonuclease
MHYIYKITNILNNKLYIGQTVKSKKRWSQHKAYAKNPEQTKQYIHRAMNKHGIENFTFEIIDCAVDQSQADCIEYCLITEYDSRNKEKGYNLWPGGNSRKGFHHSEETKTKLRAIRAKQIFTQESQLKKSKTLKGHSGYWLGKKHPNKKVFTEEQLIAIKNDPRSNRKVAIDYDVCKTTIWRLRKEYKDG